VRWLVAGGAGYIGSHLVLQLIESGHEVIVFDDLSTGRLQRVPNGVKFIEGDILDFEFLMSTFMENEVAGVIHLAGKKSVIESFDKPEEYNKTNVQGTINLLKACEVGSVKYFIFSSTAAVYKDPKSNVTLGEHSPLFPSSPYGESKLLAEKAILEKPGSQIRKLIFRFFNVTGFLNSDLAEIDAPNLVPVIQRAIADGVPVQIYGSDHQTADGTCVRDYIHILDIAEAHLAAIKHFEETTDTKAQVINLGTGTGYSVLEVIGNLETLYNAKVEKVFLKKRPGEPSSIVCDPSLAKSLLGWEVSRNPFTGNL
jgi:UDP-glucose 4-epimerase